MSQAQIPQPVLRYFGRAALLDRRSHPVVHATYVPSVGWQRSHSKHRVSVSWCRKLKHFGVTHVALTSDGRTADFTIAEIVRSAR